MTDVGLLVMFGVPARIAKGAAVPRFTGNVCAAFAVDAARPIAPIVNMRTPMIVEASDFEFFIP
jgi:hypothetical protein